jgi:hypothetical protein
MGIQQGGQLVRRGRPHRDDVVAGAHDRTQRFSLDPQIDPVSSCV